MIVYDIKVKAHEVISLSCPLIPGPLKSTIYKEFPTLLAVFHNRSKELVLLFFPLDIPNNALLPIQIHNVSASLLSIRSVGDTSVRK